MQDIAPTRQGEERGGQQQRHQNDGEFEDQDQRTGHAALSFLADMIGEEEGLCDLRQSSPPLRGGMGRMMSVAWAAPERPLVVGRPAVPFRPDRAVVGGVGAGAVVVVVGGSGSGWSVVAVGSGTAWTVVVVVSGIDSAVVVVVSGTASAVVVVVLPTPV